MKRLFRINLAGITLLAATAVSRGQGTAFTYQGRILDNGSPANGMYDFRFAAYDSAGAGTLVAGPVTNSSVAVSNGQFMTLIDFGPGVFTGPSRWLDIGVRSSGLGPFAGLAPRTALTPSPYAIFAATSSNVISGSVVKSLNGLKDNVTLAPGANVTLTPSGNTLTIAASGVGGSGIWSLNGTSTYYNLGNVGIGTTTPQENLTIAGVSSFNTGLKVTGNSITGTGIALENTSSGGHKYDLLSGGSSDGIGAGGFGLWDETAATYRFAVSSNGNVGIGTYTPGARLEVDAQDALHLLGYQPFLTFLDSNAGNARGRIQSAGGGLNLFTESYLSGADPFAYIHLDNSGKVGIGSASPTSKLDIVAQDALSLVGYNPFMTFWDSGSGYARGSIQGVAGGLNLFTESYLSGVNAFAYIHLDNSGKVGIGSATPTSKLDVVAQDALSLIGYQPFLTLWDSNAGYTRSRMQSVGGDVILETEGYLNGSSPNGYFRFYNSGNVSVGSITIRGGADVAEPFDLSTADVAKGSVVVIDPAHPGRLKLSTEPYDRRVAGVISGANGINPGLSLRQEGSLDGAQNVALSGRVYVKADATCGAIQPGDLLTTSATPGHAMKVTDPSRAQGAILGKAMSALESGRGLVLVLVTLQ